MSWLWCHFCFADPEKYDQNSKNKLVEVCFVCWRCEWWSETAGFFNQIPVDVWFSGLPSCSFFGPLIRNRHHHGGFVFFDRAIWLRAVELRSPSSWCFLLLLVVTSRSAIAIIMVLLFSVVCLPVVLRSPSSWWFFLGHWLAQCFLRNRSWPSVFANVTISIKTLIAGAPEPAPGHLGPQMVAFLSRPSSAGAPDPVLGSQIYIYIYICIYI